MSIFIETLMIDTVLRKWKEDPYATKRQIGTVYSWREDVATNRRPITGLELQRYIDRLKELNYEAGSRVESEVVDVFRKSKKKKPIRHATLLEMKEIEARESKGIDDCKHNFREDLFLYHPGQGMLNPRAFDVCPHCGSIEQINITDDLEVEIRKAIKDIVARGR